MTAFAMQDAWKLLPVPRFPYRTIVKGLLIAIAVIIDIKTKENKKSK